MSFVAKTMVGEKRAEILEDWELRAVAEEVEVEVGREMSDVNSTVSTVCGV